MTTPPASPFLSLPLELRERVYEFVALRHTTRRVSHTYNIALRRSDYKTSTSALTATCRLIHDEYEPIARKMTQVIEVTAVDLEFTLVTDYFGQNVDAAYRARLQANEAKIRVKLVIRSHERYKLDLPEFYVWAILLTHLGLDVEYDIDEATRVGILGFMAYDLYERCVHDTQRTKALRDHKEGILQIAKHFSAALYATEPLPYIRAQHDRHVDRMLRRVTMLKALGFVEGHAKNEVSWEKAGYVKLVRRPCVIDQSGQKHDLVDELGEIFNLCPGDYDGRCTI